MKFFGRMTTSIALAGSLALGLPLSAQAGVWGAQEIKRWNICDWRKLPDDVVNRITKRSDYDDILRRMFNSCPESALGLTDRPTASIANPQDVDEERRGREPDSDSPEPSPEPEAPETPSSPSPSPSPALPG